ncbi:MAG TPA: hypothetical protein VER17_19650 [Tepidisphaeraceae bacterium]|nr:hypothetical protein [Tepidisphaeraceae bacterium]
MSIHCVAAGLVAGVVFFCSGVASAAPVYFLVSEVPGRVLHGDSFVVPIERAEDIAHARDLIARGPDAAGEAIVVARWDVGSDGINRDLLKPDRPEWNWHVTEFEHFADITAEIYDLWPGYIQEHRDELLQEFQGIGRIGSWQYTITRELGTTPPGAVIPLPLALPAGAALLAGALTMRKKLVAR